MEKWNPFLTTRTIPIETEPETDEQTVVLLKYDDLPENSDSLFPSKLLHIYAWKRFPCHSSQIWCKFSLTELKLKPIFIPRFLRLSIPRLAFFPWKWKELLLEVINLLVWRPRDTYIYIAYTSKDYYLFRPTYLLVWSTKVEDCSNYKIDKKAC